MCISLGSNTVRERNRNIFARIHKSSVYGGGEPERGHRRIRNGGQSVCGASATLCDGRYY